MIRNSKFLLENRNFDSKIEILTQKPKFPLENRDKLFENKKTFVNIYHKMTQYSNVEKLI